MSQSFSALHKVCSSYFLDWKLFYKLHWNLFFLCIPSLQSLSPNSSVCLQWISSSEAAWRCVMANVFQPVSFGCILSPFLYLPNLLRPPPPFFFALNRDALYLHYPTELHYFSGHKMLLQLLTGHLWHCPVCQILQSNFTQLEHQLLGWSVLQS